MQFSLHFFLLCVSVFFYSCGNSTVGGGGESGIVYYQNLCPSFAGTWLRNDLGSGSDTCEARQIVPVGGSIDSQNSTYHITREEIVVRWNKYGRSLSGTSFTGSETANSTCSGDWLYSDAINMNVDSVTTENGLYSVTATISSISRIVHSEGSSDSGAAFLNATYNGNSACGKSDWAAGEYELNEDFSNCASDDRKHSHQSSGLSVGQTMYLTFTAAGSGIEIQISTDPDNLGSAGSWQAY